MLDHVDIAEQNALKLSEVLSVFYIVFQALESDSINETSDVVMSARCLLHRMKIYIPSFALIIRELEEIRDDLDQYVASCLTGKCGVPKCQN